MSPSRFSLLAAVALMACGGSDDATPAMAGSGSGGVVTGIGGGPSSGGAGGEAVATNASSAASGGAGDGSGGHGGAPGLGPPYPIVLAHGFFGFDSLAGIDAVTYFWGVPGALANDGETLVFTPA
ncbi:MAG: hypothetical protein WKG00_11430, partial [Polyangiaceae bacterium]